MNTWHLQQAARTVSSGGVIAYPTEAVYGLGCLPEDAAAVIRILRLKNRPLSKGLIIIAADLEQLLPYIIMPDTQARDRVLATWPGPVTWVMPARSSVPHWLTGAHETLAVRVSDHPLVSSLCRLAGPLVSTSANPSNRPPARSAMRVRAYFANKLDYILPGKAGPQSKPTEIRDALTGKILRSVG